MPLRRALPIAALLASITLPRGAIAHPINVDGDAVEWLTRAAGADNLGIIARTSTHQGEYIWRDVANDARTDLVPAGQPELIAEITGVQITGTPSGFGVLVRNVPGGVGAVGAPIQVQIAIDIDRVAGSGMDFMAGFADTKVNNAARWEFLVQTLFGSGGQATVLNTSFTGVASAQAAQGVNGVEIFVPWSALNLAGPPSAPLRFSLATFRAQSNDLTVDIGGGTSSNVVDAVTDYGDPRVTGYPNTFADVQDGVLDYFFDVFFDPQGEVYSPLVVQRFVPTPLGTEWFTVRNVSPIALPLDVFKLGDEETPDQGEGMRRFPTGATLAAGSSYTVAASAATYQTTFGALPDAEQGSTVALVPKMSSFGVWATGTIGLTAAGDELLVLDGSNTILDVATYGNGAYTGIPPKTPTPGSDIVLTRDASSSDTDDCQVDFTAGLLCTSDAACGSPCKQCVNNVCLPRPQGTSCADATVCNGAETCDATGTCAMGTPLDCNDNNVCTTDTCDAVAGCAHTPVAMGTSCDDGNVCNGTEACNAVGVCVTTAPGSCDDGNPCTIDTCNPLGGCLHTNAAMGTSCDADNDPCNGVATCNAVGVCVTAAAPSCDDGNPCTTDTCVTGMGCSSTPSPSSTPCSDGNLCNGNEVCNGAGTCMSGTPLDCDDANPCTNDMCIPATGCAHPPAAMGTPCKDANACNGDETCNGNGACVAGAPPVCTTQNPCLTASCDATLGCTTAPLVAGTPCAVDPNCTGETCDGNGTCGGGTCGMGGTGGMGTGGMGTGGMGTGGIGAGGSATGGANTGGGATGGMGTGGATATTSSSSSSSSSTSASSSGAGGSTSSSSGGLKDEGSCGCRTVGGDNDASSRAGWLAFGLVALASRRRRRSI